jgi:hypothetical protein
VGAADVNDRLAIVSLTCGLKRVTTEEDRVD